MFHAFEKMRRRQLAIGDAVTAVLHDSLKSELASCFSRPDGRLEMESLIDGHWKRVLPDQLLTMARFRAVWGCSLATLLLADLVARSCEAGRVPLLLADGRFFGLKAGESGRDVDTALSTVIAEGIALPYEPASSLWRAFCEVLASRATDVPGVEVIGAQYAGCVRLMPAPSAW